MSCLPLKGRYLPTQHNPQSQCFSLLWMQTQSWCYDSSHVITVIINKYSTLKYFKASFCLYIPHSNTFALTPTTSFYTALVTTNKASSHYVLSVPSSTICDCTCEQIWCSLFSLRTNSYLTCSCIFSIHLKCFDDQ